MAEYINIRGQSIEVVASDPANPTFGQIWYNSTSNTLKGLGYQSDSWATGGNMGTARYQLAGCGLQTAALAFGGYNAGPTSLTATEEYGGTSWTAGGALNTHRRFIGGVGIQTAGLAFGGNNIGSDLASTEEYNGSSWTSVTSMPTARKYLNPSGGFGIQTSAVVCGGVTGSPAPPTYVTSALEYDGSTWTSATAMPEAKASHSGAGILTAGYVTGGNKNGSPSYATATLEYDGTNWTSGGNLNTGRTGASGSAGTQTAGICFGGYDGTSATAITELYDGTAWSSGTSMSTSKNQFAGSGTKTAALAYAGVPTPGQVATEEYTGAGPVTRTITAS
jgi:hypothetical protein